MVSHLPQLSCTAYHRSRSTLFTKRIPITHIAVFLVLLALVVPVTAADDFSTQLCENPAVEFTYFPTNAGPYPATVHFEAKETGCSNCQWTWTVGRVGFDSSTYEDTFYYNNALDYTFNRPGSWFVRAEVYVPDQCGGFSSTSMRQEIIEISGEPLGGSGACMWLERGVIWVDPYESRGVTGRSPDFIASAPTCINCEYSWEIFEIEDPGTNPDWNSIQIYKVRDIPLESGDITQGYGNRMMSHTFQHPGVYQVAATVRNPAACPKDKFSTGGEQTAYAYYIIPDPSKPYADTVTTYPSMSVVPDITTVPVTTTITPTWTLQQDAVPVNRSFRATGDGVRTLEPIYTPAVVTTSVTLSRGGQVRGGPVTTQDRGLYHPGATEALPETSPTTTRTPGFALPAVICAGLVVLVMWRK